MRLLLLLAAAVPLFGQTTQCTYKLSAGGIVVSAAASAPDKSPSFTVTTPASCPFVAIGTAAWLHVAAPAKGANFTGAGPVSFSVDANTSAQLRTGQILVYPGTQVTQDAQSLPFVVTQVAGICNYSLSSSSAKVPVTGGSGTFTVNTGCTWGAVVTTFITITAPNGTLGTGPINYQVAANLCAAPRSGVITLQTGLPNPPVFQIVQDGSLSNFTLSPPSVTDPAGALTNQNVTVTTGAACSWRAYTDSANWLHVPATLAGSGPGAFTYSVDANVGAPRTGHIYFQSGVDLTGNPVLAATLTVTQQAIQAAGPVLAAVVNDASYDIGTPAPSSISPGEIVALFGSSLGPVTGISNTQTFGTTLAGVQVMFGAAAAPLLYVSAGQINAVVPYSTTGPSVAVTVSYNNALSPALTVPVQATTPGIFSYDRSGSGPGAILNQDYSVNSAARPAAAGSVVAIYCTGAGVTIPASTDGTLATLTAPFPALAAQPVTVTIGGVSAEVVYSGVAPGAINGLTQIDAIVPGGLKSGSSVPVVVTVGGVSSQGNLSMAVQ